MAYRRTERVAQRLAARHDAIIAAARAVASEGGMAAVQIAPVAERAGIAAGTVYRYFPAKTDLVAALVAAVSERRNSARCARRPMPRRGRSRRSPRRSRPSPARALRNRRLAWAVIAEPVDAEVDAVRLDYRKALAAEFEARIAPPSPAAICPSRTRRSPRRRWSASCSKA